MPLRSRLAFAGNNHISGKTCQSYTFPNPIALALVGICAYPCKEQAEASEGGGDTEPPEESADAAAEEEDEEDEEEDGTGLQLNLGDEIQ